MKRYQFVLYALIVQVPAVFAAARVGSGAWPWVPLMLFGMVLTALLLMPPSSTEVAS